MVRWGRVTIGVGILSLVGVAGVKAYQYFREKPIPENLINRDTAKYVEFKSIEECIPRPSAYTCYWFDIRYRNTGELGEFNFRVDDWYGPAYFVNAGYIYPVQALNMLAQLKWLGHMSQEDFDRLKQEMIDAGWDVA